MIAADEAKQAAKDAEKERIQAETEAANEGKIAAAKAQAEFDA